ALLFVATLIAVNKVGSPQYVGWYAVPVVWGLVAGYPSARRFLPVAIGLLPLALLTQVIYPGFYDQLLAVRPWMVSVLTVRNALEVVVLVWAVVVLVRLARRSSVPAPGGPAVRPPAARPSGRPSASTVEPPVHGGVDRGRMDA
ncbi:hypothetical protein NS263_14110, partial [Curtobacterium oceanosedimentum]